jgi:hypothetical protein
MGLQGSTGCANMALIRELMAICFSSSFFGFGLGFAFALSTVNTKDFSILPQ